MIKISQIWPLIAVTLSKIEIQHHNDRLDTKIIRKIDGAISGPKARNVVPIFKILKLTPKIG